MGSILSKPIGIMDMVFYYNIVACDKVIYVGRTFNFNPFPTLLKVTFSRIWYASS